MQMSPIIAVHMTAALGATLVGPLALWARQGRTQRPRLHRAFGYAWVTLMVVTAVSALFIRDFNLPNIGGYTPIHLLVPAAFAGMFGAFWFLAQGNIARHRRYMLITYASASLVAGGFTLLPNRYLGNLVWGQWLGLISPHNQPPRGPSVIGQILMNTPLWVWGLLAALLVLGWSQTRSRSVGLARITLLPLGLGALSLYGVFSAFGASPAVLGSWLAAAILLALMVTQMPLPAGAAYDPARRQFQLPGSWVPMALIMGIFLTKYMVGVGLAINPALKANTGLTLAIATLYGVFSGIFAGRTVRLLRLARQPAAPAMTTLHA